MKADGVDASVLPSDLHIAVQQKLMRTLDTELTDERVWSGLVFGMTSPNNPLFPNQLAASRLRIHDPADLDRIAGMIDWEPGANIPKATREAASARIADATGPAG